MKKAGFPPHMAGAVEACSSTGGVLMPPIMGAVAFLMASWLKMPYIQVAAAAVIPSILYYVSLFLQVDAFAARNGLAGIPRKELPSIGKTMKWGWQYIFVLVLLVVLMVVLQREAETPFYATAMLLVISSFRKETRLNWPRFVRFVQACGRVFVDMLPMLAAVGLIIGALSVTGMAITFAGDLTRIAGGSLPALLVMGAITSFILGMGMSVSACYLFLAIVLAPALISQGLNPVAVHLYLLYWGMISFITPPVAAGAFAGSILAKAPFMKTALTSMRLAGSIYFIPFFFVLNPTLIFQQFELPGFLLAFACSGIAVFVVSSGLQGYMAGIGELKAALFTWPGRFLLVVGGVLIGLPVDYSRIAGIAVLALSVVLFLVIRRMTVSSAR
jgi:TRAP transporter 4TM/12TM fusion protein